MSERIYGLIPPVATLFVRVLYLAAFATIAGCSFSSNLRIRGSDLSESGTSSRKMANTCDCNGGWLSEAIVTNQLDDEYIQVANQGLRSGHENRMIELQNNADVLLELVDAKHLKILRSDIHYVRIGTVFPIRKLDGFAVRIKHGKSNACVVVTFPNTYAYEDPLPMMIREFDSVLCNAGLEKRIYEFKDYNYWFSVVAPAGASANALP